MEKNPEEEFKKFLEGSQPSVEPPRYVDKDVVICSNIDQVQ